MLELPKFRKTAAELTDSWDAWCYFLAHGDELDKSHLPRALDTPMIQKAMEVLDMLSHNEVERERYRARLKWERDQKVLFDEAHAQIEQAREQALQAREQAEQAREQAEQARGQAEHAREQAEQARALGIREGELMGRIQVFQRMLRVPLTPNEELKKLTMNELQAQANALEDQLGLPKG